MTVRLWTSGALLLAAACAAGADDFRLPADSGAIDVTRPPFSARGDGQTDCTAALSEALAPKGRLV